MATKKNGTHVGMIAEFSLKSCALDLPVLRFDHPSAARRVLDVTRGRAGRPILFFPFFDVSSSRLNGVNGLISPSAGGGVGTLTLVLRCTSRKMECSLFATTNGLLGASVKIRIGDKRGFSGDIVGRIALG